MAGLAHSDKIDLGLGKGTRQLKTFGTGATAGDAIGQRLDFRRELPHRPDRDG